MAGKKATVFAWLLVFSIILTACTVPTNHPATIDPETTTSTTHTVPTITRPTTSVLPSTLPSEPKEPYLVHNPYLIDDAYREKLGEDYELYCSFVDAMLAYESTIPGFSSEQQPRTIWEIFMTEFYPARAICATYHDTDTPFSYEDGIATVCFKLDEQEHHQLLSDYEFIINDALSFIDEDDNEVEIIEKIYEYVSCTMSYDIGRIRVYTYECILSGTGVCRHYAEYMILLLHHAGIEAFSCSSDCEAFPDFNHMWVIARMNGQYYHFDPTWQSVGLPWQWFAMSDEARYGSLQPQGLEICLVEGSWPSDADPWVIYVYRDTIPYKNGLPAIPACIDTYYDEYRFIKDSYPSQW